MGLDTSGIFQGLPVMDLAAWELVFVLSYYELPWWFGTANLYTCTIIIMHSSMSGAADSAQRQAPGATQREYVKRANLRKQFYILHVFAHIFNYIRCLSDPIMEAASGCLHNRGPAAFGHRHPLWGLERRRICPKQKLMKIKYIFVCAHSLFDHSPFTLPLELFV